VVTQLRIITVPSALSAGSLSSSGLVAQELSEVPAGESTAADPAAQTFVNTTGRSSSPKAGSSEGLIATSSARSAVRLSAQSLDVALSDLGTDDLPASSKRATVDSDLLELLSQR
jgi:hypothetical protein